jgi:hypothetical protein
MRRIAPLTLVVLALAVPATAHATITPSRDATALAGAIADGGVAGAAFTEIPPGGNPAAIADTPLAGFPLQGASYAILASGDTTLAASSDQSAFANVGNGGPASHGTALDVTILRIDVNVPSPANCVTLSFRFLSEEFPEFVGGDFNDGFIAELDASTWSGSGSGLSAPDNFAFDEQGNVISVNTSTMSAEEASGTIYGGATPRLSAAQATTPGAHSLYLSIFDQGDDGYDSAVFLDRLGFITTEPDGCVPGATQDETPPVVTLTSPADGSTTADATPTLSGTAGTTLGDSTVVTAEIYAGTTTSGTPVQSLTTVHQDGPWSVDAAELGDGVYTARALQSDAAGNTGASETSTFEVDADTTPPAVTISSPTDGSTVADTSPTLTGSAGTAEGDSTTVTVHLFAGPAASGSPVQSVAVTQQGGQWSAETAPLAEGQYTARAEQPDDGDNTGVSAPVTFTIRVPPPPQQQILAAQQESPAPVIGSQVVAGTVSGTVRVREPDGTFRVLGPGEAIPVGSVVDARKGVVRLTSAADASGTPQTADFSRGQFRVTQSRSGLTDLTLSGGSFRSCGARASASQRRGKRIRRLFGDGKGKFRTTGRHGAATVRGTRWGIEDRCDGTYISVQQGSVTVRDFTRRRTVTVKRGKTYRARAKQRRR